MAQEEAENAKTGDIGEMLNQLKSQKTGSSEEKLSVSDAVKMADEASSTVEKAKASEAKKTAAEEAEEAAPAKAEEKKPVEDEKLLLSEEVTMSPIDPADQATLLVDESADAEHHHHHHHSQE